jgi:hypothetical protein
LQTAQALVKLVQFAAVSGLVEIASVLFKYSIDPVE